MRVQKNQFFFGLELTRAGGGIPDRDNIYRLAEVIGVSVEDIYHIISQREHDSENMSINITSEVINLLESYGYKVSAPKQENILMKNDKK